MRIANIAPPWMAVPPAGCGGETVLDILTRGLAGAGHDVLLFTTGDSTGLMRRDWVFDAALAWASPAPPFGTVMIEALACGTSGHRHPGGGGPEIVVRGLTGYLADPEADMISSPCARRRIWIGPPAAKRPKTASRPGTWSTSTWLSTRRSRTTTGGACSFGADPAGRAERAELHPAQQDDQEEPWVLASRSADIPQPLS